MCVLERERERERAIITGYIEYSNLSTDPLLSPIARYRNESGAKIRWKSGGNPVRRIGPDKNPLRHMTQKNTMGLICKGDPSPWPEATAVRCL